MANMIFVLAQEVAMTILAICAVVENAFIIYIILSSHLLRSDSSLYLIMTLAAADFLMALTVFPYLILLLCGWGFTVNYPPLPMLLLNLPVTMGLKISEILACGIAADRLAAIQWPVAYRVRKRSTFTAVVLAVGILWAVFDATFEMSITEIKPIPNCAAAGCFVNPTYVSYSGFSNMFVDSIALLITAIVLLKIKKWSRSIRTTNAGANDNEDSVFKKANRAAVGVLLCSSVTVFIPGCVQGVGTILGYSMFQLLGPFVALGLILKAAVNPFIYAFRHRDIRQGIANCFNMSSTVSDVNRRHVQRQVPIRLEFFA